MRLPKSLNRERLIAAGISVVFLAVVLFWGLRWIEWSITFHPTRIASATRPKNAEDVWLTTADQLRLHGWYFHSKDKPAVATIVYFHGNGGNISNLNWVGEEFSSRGFDVFLFDYRGYGESEGKPVDEIGLYADGDAAYNYVVNERHVQPERLVLHGQSLGTAVVADLASRKRCGVVILESGLSSARSIANTAIPWLPRWLHFLGRNRFDSIGKVAKIRVPILISHGDPDPVIPTKEGHALFAAANQPKRLLIFPGAGHNVFGSVGDKYLNQIESFIRESVK
jgi:uncharacterized protein